jgi:hypothetical protein
MTQLLNTLKAVLIPQPPVLDPETIRTRTFWRSVFMQAELGGDWMPDWKVIAEVESMKLATCTSSALTTKAGLSSRITAYGVPPSS